MNPSDSVISVGSGMAVLGALFSVVQDGSQALTPALLVGLAGVITAVGGIISGSFVPMFKLWMDQLRIEREAKWARHNLADHINELRIENLNMKATIEQNQIQIDQQKELNLNLSRTLASYALSIPPKEHTS